MRKDIINRLDKVRTGEIPEGYQRKRSYTIPKDWKVCRLQEHFLRLTRKNNDNNQNVLTISAKQGLISQEDYYNHSYASEDKSGYTLLRRGDFSYNKSYSGDYPYGAIKRLEAFDIGIVSPLYICFESKPDTVSDYYLHYFEAGVFNHEIYRIAQEGARNHGLLNIAIEEFFSAFLLSPPCKEQQKIAEILNYCDKVIALKQQLIEEERKRKKWLMERLFSNKKEVNMSNYKNYWRNVTYRDVCKFLNGRAYSQNELLTTGKYRVLRVGNLFTKMDWYYSDLELSSDKYVDNEDLIYSWSASFGPAIWRGDKVIYHYHIWKVVPYKGISRDYLYQYLQYDASLLYKEQQGGTMSHITKEAMERRRFTYPDLTEQVAIANTLSTQDHKNDLLLQELAEWQQKKKALMQLLLTGLVRVAT